MSETITVRGGSMPVPMYLRLLPLAEQLDVTVFDLLVELARRKLTEPKRRAPRARRAPARRKSFEERQAANPRAHRTWTTDDTERMRELHHAGLIDSEIAAVLRSSATTVSRHRQAAGLARNDPRKAVKAA